MSKPRLHVGISGWTYPPWRGGAFFPEDLPQKRELEYASRQVNSIEINGSFYSLQRPSSYRAWHAATPPGFIFSVKGGRFITHIKRLRNIEAPLANFFASGVLLLKEKLGPFLWQLPPSLRYDPGLIEDFIRMLPRDARSAAALARRHDQAVADRAWTRTDRNRPFRHAMEVRHESFMDPGFIDLLRRHHIALVVADTAGKWPFMEDMTSDFVYARLHGDTELYASGYGPRALDDWTRKIRSWQRGATPRGSKLHAPPLKTRASGRDVYVYFDNDVKVRAPYDAMSLAHRLRIGPKPPRFTAKIKHVRDVPRQNWPGFARNTAR